MKHAAADIERIVREVLARLDAAGALADKKNSKAKSNGTAKTETKPDQLVLSARVVTLAETEGQLKGIRQVVVAPGAVVTPSVRDELIRRRITLSRSEEEPSVAADANRLVVVTSGTSFDSSKLTAALAKDGCTFDEHKVNCAIRATGLLAEELADGTTLGVLLSRHTDAALCLANRHRTLRAVAGVNLAGIKRAADAIGANLLIIDPTRAGFFQLKQAIDTFRHGGMRPCPEVLIPHLT